MKEKEEKTAVEIFDSSLPVKAPVSFWDSFSSLAQFASQ
jgi:hypothetical protein